MNRTTLTRSMIALAAVLGVTLTGCAQSPEEEFVAAVNEQTDILREQNERSQQAAQDTQASENESCLSAGQCSNLTITPELGAKKDFTGADLTNASVPNDVDLSGADFTGANLTGASFYTYGPHPSLDGVSFSGANLTNTRLINNDLSGADFTGANLTGASLHGSDLSGADFTGANLTGTDLGSTDLTGAIGIPTQALLDSTSVVRCPDGKPDPTNLDFWSPDYSSSLSAGEQINLLVPCEWPAVGTVNQERFDQADAATP